MRDSSFKMIYIYNLRFLAPMKAWRLHQPQRYLLGYDYVTQLKYPIEITWLT